MVKALSVLERLEKAVSDYLLQMVSNGYADSTCMRYEQALKHFLHFINQMVIPWDAVFTFETLKNFQKESGLIRASSPVRGLSRYLFEQNKIRRPIEKPIQKLPEIYEDYLLYYAKTRQVLHLQLLRSRRTLQALNDYLAKHNIKLPKIRIEHIDAFLSERNVNFISHKGGLKKSFATSCRKANIPCGRKVENGFIFHDIRRTVKTNMLNAGVDKVHRDVILGHSIEGMDVHYLAPSEDTLRDAMVRYTQWLDCELDSASVDQIVDHTQKQLNHS
jgi:hypothetical protein